MWWWCQLPLFDGVGPNHVSHQLCCRHPVATPTPFDHTPQHGVDGREQLLQLVLRHPYRTHVNGASSSELSASLRWEETRVDQQHGHVYYLSIIYLSIIYTKSPWNFLQTLLSHHVALLQTLLDRHMALSNLTIDFQLYWWARYFGPLE